MSGHGRKAVLPPARHRAAPRMAPDGLVVTVLNKAGYAREYDFAELPVAGPMQRSLAASFAVQSRNWTSHRSARAGWNRVLLFTDFLSQLQNPPQDLDGLTVLMLQNWRDRHIATNTGKNTLSVVRRLLANDPRLAAGPVAEELARRVPDPAPSKQSYEEAERDRVLLAAQRQFRAAWMRIRENTARLEAWRAGDLVEGSRDWRIGQVLDHLAQSGDVPRRLLPGEQSIVINRRLLGGSSTENTWGRLFLPRRELISLAVLLSSNFAWNMSVYDRMPTPSTAPSAGETASVTYQVQVEKRRSGEGRWFSTENITDSGADSPGRLVTQALEATAWGRALVSRLAPGTDLLMTARTAVLGREPLDLDRPRRVGPLVFGVSDDDAKWWAHSHGLAGSPFQRIRRTTVTREGRPLQHTQGTHESVYVLPDQQVQRASREVFEAGAHEALDQARDGVVIYDNPDAFRICAFKHDNALCEPKPGATAPRQYACQSGCGNTVRTDAHAHQLRQRVKEIEQLATHSPDRIAKRLRANAAKLRATATPTTPPPRLPRPSHEPTARRRTRPQPQGHGPAPERTGHRLQRQPHHRRPRRRG
ncbi:hypothetical protein [Streptomyces sp. NPDC048473]|uniref:hypothetical protein n=1 Tax=unclassified Streptomyces TaxID=2593676 RepID=UPI00371BE788